LAKGRRPRMNLGLSRARARPVPYWARELGFSAENHG
jgi:hypothetical protein